MGQLLVNVFSVQASSRGLKAKAYSRRPRLMPQQVPLLNGSVGGLFAPIDGSIFAPF